MSDTIDDILGDMGLDVTTEIANETPEQKLFRELTDGRYPKLHTLCIYWLKHELYVYKSLLERNWQVTKASGTGRVNVSYLELSRALLKYYFLMTHLPRFEGEDAIRRGMACDMEKFLDLVLDDLQVKKLVENPTLLT